MGNLTCAICHWTIAHLFLIRFFSLLTAPMARQFWRFVNEGHQMARQSTQHKLDRVRPPRVQVTYDVEVGDAIEIKELPFVMGVLGDFTGQPTEPLPRVKDRKFVEVNPDNFDAVLEGMKPHLSFTVENKLSEDPNAGNLEVDLHFKSLEDFEPEQVAKQVKPLKELLDLRERLAICAAACRATTSSKNCCGKR